MQYDVAPIIPVSHYAPHLNLLVESTYKIRAVIDTGSTTTVMTLGLFHSMPLLKNKLQPTSFTDLTLQFSDKLSTPVNIAVLPNPKKFLLIGNDLVGGAYAELARAGQTDPLGYVVLQDKKGRQDVVQINRNRELG